MQELKHPYPSVEKDGRPSYGGNQGWSGSGTVRRCGCGAVAATDLLLYLHRFHPGCRSDVFRKIPNNGAVALKTYNSLVDRLRKRFFFVIPRFGMNGFMVSRGLNRYFRRNSIPLRAKWGIWRWGLWSSIEKMIYADLPVICSVGPNFPLFWKNYKLQFYIRTKDGGYRPSAMTKAHYVTITGIDDQWLKISSWGREYYINREEYKRYVAKHSSYLFSNVVRLRKC